MSHADGRDPARRRAFTLVELLVVVAIVALLIGIMLPALGAARETARTVVCLSNQRQLAIAWQNYADEQRDRPVPFVTTAGTQRRYWWGVEDVASGRFDTGRGPLGPYLDAGVGDRSVFECPAQREGTYEAQGQIAGAWTTTYGYNAYYLTPATSGYAELRALGSVRVSSVRRPSDLFVFGDAMILRSGALFNSGLLDPPQLYHPARGWRPNGAPTTAFRHRGSVVTARADLSAAATAAQGEWLTHERPAALGSVGLDNGPHYVPDWDSWGPGAVR